MCTAFSIVAVEHYFGRNLDFEHEFGEKIVVTPREFSFSFRNGEVRKEHYAMIGMALVCDDYPLYFDAINEKGLAMAGLNFPEYARYNEKIQGRENIASFELIPWILCRCETIADVKKLLKKMNITNEAFNEKLLPTPLHWIIADKKETIVVEQTKNGLFIYENHVGVLTNSPEFPFHLLNLKNFSSVTVEETENRFSEIADMKPYSRGMGGIGLPGDYSSASRFVRACFVALNSVFDEREEKNVHQFFHCLNSVAMPKGCVKVNGAFEITNYSCCYNTEKGICYYTTYFNNTIYAVDMNNENLNSEKLIIYNKEEKGSIMFQNKKFC